jgi:alpha-1,6-mannosyltransferase
VTSVHFTNAYHDSSGGIRTFYDALLAAAPRHGRHVRLVVPGERDAVDDVNAFARIYVVQACRSPVIDRRYRLILPHRFLWPGAGPLWSILDREQPDLVEICDKYSLCYFAGLVRKLRRRRPALVGLTCERMDDNVRAFVSDAPAGTCLARRYMHDVYVPQFDAHIANSAYTAAEVPRNLRHPRPVYVRHMGVDTVTFTLARRSRQRRERRRLTWGVPFGAPLLVYAGRLSAEKHAHLLIDMMRFLEPAAARLVLAGDGPLRGDLERRATTECPGRVRFLGNLAGRADLADLLADADVFVHPNPREPFGIAPLEAMAAGLPVVVPDRGGVTSYAGAHNAWPAAPNGASLAMAVLDAVMNGAERERRRQGAFDTAAAHAWPAATAAYFDLYDEIAAATASSRNPSGQSASPEASRVAAGVPTATSAPRLRDGARGTSGRGFRRF